MNLKRLISSALLALFVGFALSYIGYENICAFFLAVFVHELGHIMALWLLGLKIKGFVLELSGLRIDYSAFSAPKKEAAAALAGPAAGILYFFIMRRASYVFALSAELSLLYALFNIMPVLPLDGGRALLCLSRCFPEIDKSERFFLNLSLVLSIAFLAVGFVLLAAGEGSAVFSAGLWILLMQTENIGIVKKP